MESRIVRDFQNLRVFAGRLTSVNMDDLVQDLSFALEDASSMNRARSTDSIPALMNQAMKRQHKKRRSVKRRSLGPAGCRDSEASESSIDEALKDYMENVTVRSDSDDCPRAARMPTPLHQNIISLVESDSLTENFSPLRPIRRRRKFKRMAVDACQNDEFAIPNARTLRPKRMKSRPKSDENEAETGRTVETTEEDSIAAAENKDGCSRMDTSVDGDTLTRKSGLMAGKRKRTYKQSDSGQENETTESFMEEMASQSGSAISSSETTDDESTPDESREADDEQSDFFHEPGPACGIPGMVPWWGENEQNSEVLSDPELQQILFSPHVTVTSQHGIKARLTRIAGANGREIRYGRRRLNDKIPRYSMARYMQDRQKWREPSGTSSRSSPLRTVWGNPPNTVETKRRRKTPPNSSNEVMTTPEPDVTAPDPSEIGSKMLEMMGWSSLTPGSTIKVPAQSSRSRRSTGHPYDMDDDSNS